MSETTTPLGADLEAMLARLNQRGKECAEYRVQHAAWAATQPQTLLCSLHQVERAIDWERSLSESFYEKQYLLRYQHCAKCVEYKKVRVESSWLIRAGVPENMGHCSFDNFQPRNEEDVSILRAAKGFSRKRVGFLLMLGENGLGKTHLAVALLRDAKGGKLITNQMLLDQLRKSYGSRRGVDIKERCKEAKLLVLDELGMSQGGADELPMIHDILSSRHDHKRRTIVTGNFENKQQFCSFIGARMASRLEESCYKLLWFKGESHRPKMHQAYFDDQATQDPKN